MQDIATEEFQSELEQKWQAWLVKRFIKYCVLSFVLIVFFGFLYVYVETTLETRPVSALEKFILFAFSNLPILISLIGGIEVVRRKQASHEVVMRVIVWTIAVIGFFSIVISNLTEWLFIRETDFLRAIKPGPIIISVLGVHLFACIFIPFQKKDAIKIVIPLLLMSIPLILISQTFPLWLRCVLVVIDILVCVPGVVICFVRANRYSDRFFIQRLSGNYSDLKREMSAARQIHEMLFPNEVTEGEIQVRYYFEPMRHLGGDFPYIRHHYDQDGTLTAVSTVIVDVTGHGISAALAVNRLHGEIERLFAEYPDASPHQLTCALNKYIYLTLSRESIYATAFACKAHMQDARLEWVNAGHPQPYLLKDHGQFEGLFTSALMLGAVNEDHFKPETNFHDLQDHYRILMYTDGIIEARNSKGKMLKNEGLEKILSQSNWKAIDDGLLKEIASGLKDFRSGGADDDVLLVEMKRRHSKL